MPSSYCGRINHAQVQKRVSLTIAIYPLLAIANFIPVDLLRNLEFTHFLLVTISSTFIST